MNRDQRDIMAHTRRAYALAMRRAGLTLREIGARLGGISQSRACELIRGGCVDERLDAYEPA